ncbi:hypothetical protein ACXR2T_10130 [Leucobacter sp. HY1910]
MRDLLLFVLGLITVPAVLLLGWGALLLTGRLRGYSHICDACDWPFAGLRENYLAFDNDDEWCEEVECGFADEETARAQLPHHPLRIHAICSQLWHDQVVMRDRIHRASWSDLFDRSPREDQESMLPYAHRYGAPGRSHELRSEEDPSA